MLAWSFCECRCKQLLVGVEGLIGAPVCDHQFSHRVQKQEFLVCVPDRSPVARLRQPYRKTSTRRERDVVWEGGKVCDLLQVLELLLTARPRHVPLEYPILPACQAARKSKVYVPHVLCLSWLPPHHLATSKKCARCTHCLSLAADPNCWEDRFFLLVSQVFILVEETEWPNSYPHYLDYPDYPDYPNFPDFPDYLDYPDCVDCLDSPDYPDYPDFPDPDCLHWAARPRLPRQPALDYPARTARTARTERTVRSVRALNVSCFSPSLSRFCPRLGWRH